MPWVMGRLWYNYTGGFVSVEGHYGQEEIYDLGSTTQPSTAHDMKTFSGNVSLQATSGPVQFTGRAFVGENLNSFFGGCFQGFTRDSTSVTNVKSKGGWANVKYTINPTWFITVGGGMDDPDDATLVGDMRSRQDWGFGNIGLVVSKSLVFMFEGSYIKTHYMVSPAGDNIRAQLATIYKF
jgi:hypothetical protein